MKYVFLLLGLAAVLLCAACSTQRVPETESKDLSIPASSLLNAEEKALWESLDKSNARCVPLLFLPEAESAYRLFLGRTVPKDHEVSRYVLVKTANGAAEIVRISDAFAATPPREDEALCGGWNETLSREIPESVQKALKTQPDPMESIAILASQVVAGMHYNVLCHSENGYAVAQLYADLEGNADVTGIYAFE